MRQWLVRIRNGVGTRDKNLYEAQWLACVLLYRRFAAALTGDCARLEADVVSYSFIVSELHRRLVAGLPAHCERFWTLRHQRGDRENQRPRHEAKRSNNLVGVRHGSALPFDPRITAPRFVRRTRVADALGHVG